MRSSQGTTPVGVVTARVDHSPRGGGGSDRGNFPPCLVRSNKFVGLLQVWGRPRDRDRAESENGVIGGMGVNR